MGPTPSTNRPHADLVLRYNLIMQLPFTLGELPLTTRLCDKRFGDKVFLWCDNREEAR